MLQLIKVLEGGDTSDCNSAALALFQTGPTVVPQLVNLLENQDMEVRRAKDALGQIGPAAGEAVPQLIKLLEKQDTEVRLSAAFALRQIGPAAGEAVPQLIKLLEDQDKQVRDSAALALGQIGPAAGEAVPQLIKLLEDKDDQVRDSAAFALGQIGPAAAHAVLQLIKLLEDKDDQVRDSAAFALGQIGPAAGEAVPQLIKLLEDQDKQVRDSAALALGQIGPAAGEAVPQLVKLLENQDTEVRLSTAFALRQIGPAAGEAVPQLIKLFDDQDDQVRDSAAFALAKIDPEVLPRESLILELGNASSWGSEIHDLLLQLVCSTYATGMRSQDSAAALEVLWHSEDTIALRWAVRVLPGILKTTELTTFQLRSLVQRLLRIVPDTVVECKLHELLEAKLADDTLPFMEHATSLADSRDGVASITESLNSNTDITALLDCQSGRKLGKCSDVRANSSSDGEAPLPLYALREPRAATESSEGLWTDGEPASSELV